MKKLFSFLQGLTILPTVLLLSLFIGVASVEIFLRYGMRFGDFTIDSWHAFPAQGTKDADPYTRVQSLQNGALPLGRAEGLRFEIAQDDEGRPLKTCYSYVLEGQVPTASFFTLYAAQNNNKLQPLYKNESNFIASKLPVALHSFDMLYHRDDEGFTVFISPYAQPGNWLATRGKARKYRLVLSLYNTALLTRSDLQKYTMPRIHRLKMPGGMCE